MIWREFEKTLGDGGGQGSQVCSVHGVTKIWTQLSDWTTTTEKADNLNERFEFILFSQNLKTAQNIERKKKNIYTYQYIGIDLEIDM